MAVTRLRLGISLTSIRRQFAQVEAGEGGGGAGEDTGLVDRFGILLQDGGFVITQNQEFLVRQIADRNIILTQDGLEILTQSGGNIFLQQDSLNLSQVDSETGLGLSILTQSGGDILLNG